MHDTFTVRAKGREFSLGAEPGAGLARTLFLAGFFRGLPLCAGFGRCGLCRVRFDAGAPRALAAEADRLGAEAVDRGWRLSCLHPATAGSVVEVDHAPEAVDAVPELPPVDPELRLAVDLGTTAVKWRAWRPGSEPVSGGILNPQAGLGAEVVSRLGFAGSEAGRAVLRNLVERTLAGIAAGLGAVPGSWAVSGNPAMIHLMLGLEVRTLAEAPYSLEYTAGCEAEVFQGWPRAYLPPLLSPFVGSDISAGLAWLLSSDACPERPFVFADLGTNGEFALVGADDGLILASAPMGPALEGVGLSCGRLAGPRVAVGYALTPKGLEPRCLDGPCPGKLSGIAGPGYLSLASALVRAGALDRSGLFAAPGPTLGGRLAATLESGRGQSFLPLGRGLRLAASDVEELLKVKAAFNAALSLVQALAGLDPGAVRAYVLAGALGEHADPGDLETLGFLPPGASRSTMQVGNSSLAGTALMVADPASRTLAESLPGRAQVANLAGDPGFQDAYIQRMVFDHVP